MFRALTCGCEYQDSLILKYCATHQYPGPESHKDGKGIIIRDLEGQVATEHSDMLQYHHAFYSEAELHEATKQKLSAMETKNQDARRTGEYWKAEHLAGNKKIQELELQIRDQQGIVDAAVALVRWHGAGALQSEPYFKLFVLAGRYLLGRIEEKPCEHDWQDLGDSAKALTHKCRRCDTTK